MAGRRNGSRSRAKGGGSRARVQRGIATHQKQRAREADALPAADPFSGELWDALRQGARNVAGVRYQLAVTAHLLVESRRGALPFIEVIPEGFEDIDCRDQDSVRWFVQVKEVGAGVGSFTAASVADAISHAAAAAPSPSRIVVVTDAKPGRQVAETGWDRPIAETAGYDMDGTIRALVFRGHQLEEAEELVTRAHVVRLPWNMTPATTTSLAASYSINPTVAGIVVSRLLEDLTGVAADQRATTADWSGRRTLNDLDALVERTMAAIDVDGLESAVHLGICETADYTVGPATDLGGFLLGVDAAPSHIGANYDVIRPGPTRAVQVGLEQARYVLVAGPSGSGKSAQMWRSARDLSPAARVVRVHRLETEAEVDELVRYVRLLSPGTVGPVVVCCDDLGRPRTARWPLAARRLLDERGVLLLGAVRQEDFTAELLRYGGELVTLLLDHTTAAAIADQLSFVGVSLALEIPEAVREADGQLMEFVALLTSGKHMRAVLAAQVQSLLDADDPTAAGLARLVCAAHVLGVSLDASTIQRAARVGQASLSRALRRLQDEHIVTSEDGVSWRGLHQRRSDVLTELLHGAPPPSLSTTMGAVLRAIRPAGLGWSLRRMVELLPDLPADQMGAVEQAVSGCSSAEELAVLIESLERADNSMTAKSYIPVLERYRRPQIPLLNWAMLVCGDKFAGIRFGAGGDSVLDRMGRHVRACAEDLPSRCTTYCDTAAAACADRLVGLLTVSSLEGAVRLLEAIAPYVSVSGRDLQHIAERFAWPDGILDKTVSRLHGRLRSAAHVATHEENEFAQAWGSASQRLDQAARSTANVISASLTGDDPKLATLQLLAHPVGEDDSPHFAWDLQPRRDQRDEMLNRSAVDLATFVGECCPELEVVEVITILANGERLRLGDLEPGHKRLPRDARPARDVVRMNVGVQAAIARQAAAYSWTEVIRHRTRIATLVSQLTEEAPRRLSRNDNSYRRADWVSRLDEVDRLLADLPRPPATSELDIGRAAASWDSDRKEDDWTAALRHVASALRLLVPEEPGRLVPAGACGQARYAAIEVALALSKAELLTTGEEHEAYAGLLLALNRLSGLLCAIAFDPTLPSKVKGSPERFSGKVDQLIEVAAARQFREERMDVKEAFLGVPNAEVIQVSDEDAFVTSIVGHQWLVTVPPESWEAALSVAAERQWRITDVPVSVVCEIDGVLLPIAVRLSTMVSTGFLPLGPESVEQLASAAGKSTVGGPTLSLVGEVALELTLASWENARLRMRPPEWPTPGGDPLAHLAEARRLIDRAPSEAHDVLGTMQDLVSRIGLEFEGETDGTVAAELAGTEVFDSAEVGDEHAMTPVTQAVMAALDLELTRAMPSDDTV